MRALVVYESIYGNTHAVADGIAVGLRPYGDVRVVPVHEATGELVAWADLVVVGGPTHAHGMTRASTRKGAVDAAATPDTDLAIDPDAAGPGVRDWLGSLGKVRGTRAAAFDTRVNGPVMFTGRASGGIANGLRHLGFTLVDEPESFLVDRHTHLVAGEAERAAQWGTHLAEALAPAG
jgi:Flavodoxin domain